MTASESIFARKRQATTNAILEATSEIIAEKGVDAFTMSEVAQRAGVNRSLIYHYFTTRENLVLQAIRHIVYRYDAVRPEMGPDALERTARMHIEHPEVGRFFFQLFLTGRPLPAFAERMRDAIDDLQRLKTEHAPNADFDPALIVTMAWLVQLAWSFSRDEIARNLGITAEEADRRLILNLRRAARLGIEAIMRGE